jgi:hypothetical protein
MDEKQALFYAVFFSLFEEEEIRDKVMIKEPFAVLTA